MSTQEHSTNVSSSEVLCRIVHLSDIHVGAAFDTDLWGMVKERIPELKPNIIIVSGDIVDTPRFTSFRRARRLFDQLLNDCRNGTPEQQSPLFLSVPGNHDLAFYGNDMCWSIPLGIRWLSKPLVVTFLFFLNFFWAKWVGKLGYKAYFERNAHELKWYQRVFWLYPSLAWELVKAKTTRKLFRSQVSTDTRLALVEEIVRKTGVLIVPFQSYSSAWFASGTVAYNEIFGLTTLMARLRKHPGIHLRRRIAVVHHHPVPIPYTPEREGLIEFEPYLCFRNAGTFLRELFSYNFDLVLHGHRHIPNFMRLNYNYKDEEGELGILSAGSAALRTIEPNAFNIVTVFRNGEVSLSQVVYGGGRGLHKVPSSASLFSIVGRKKNAFRRSVEAQGFFFERIVRSIAVDKHGTSVSRTELNGLKVVGAVEKRRRPVLLTTDQGCIYYVRCFSDSVHESISLDPLWLMPCRTFSSEVVFNRNINEMSEGFSYGIEARIISSHAMSLQQSERMGRPSVGRSVFFVTAPVKSLEFKIELPNDFAIEKMRFEVTYCPAVMECQLKSDGEIPLSEVKVDERVPDSVLQEHERTISDSRVLIHGSQLSITPLSDMRILLCGIFLMKTLFL